MLVKPSCQHPADKSNFIYREYKSGRKNCIIAAPKFKKLSLELGGKNPNIIFADCNWDKMMTTSVLSSSFANQGEICLCGSRILIEEKIYEKFKTEFVDRIKKLKVGDPIEENIRQGAIVSKVHFEKIMRCIDTAKKEGGKILCGGNAIKMKGRCAEWIFH